MIKKKEKLNLKIGFPNSKFFVHVFMVVATFPLAKIGLLLLKQLSKPLANIIKNEAKRHYQVRKYVIVPTGRAYRWIENQSLIHMKGVKPYELEPLTEEEAVELGANAIGEIILFGLLSIIVLAEYNRQGDKKAVIEKTKEEEMLNLQDTVIELLEQVDKLKKNVEQLQEELISGRDALELEEQRHTFIYDHNFWDVMSYHKNKKKNRKEKKDDSVDLSNTSL